MGLPARVVFVILVAPLLALPSAAHADRRGGITRLARLSLDEFRTTLEGRLQDRVNAAQATLRDPHASEASKATAREDLAAMNVARAELMGVGQLQGLYVSLRDAGEAISDLDKDYAKYGSVGAGTVLTTELFSVKMARVARDVETSAKTLDLVAKWGAMRSAVAALDTQGYGPGPKRLATALTRAAHVLSAFGDKVPLIGSILKGYGDCTQALLDATHEIEGQIERNIDQGHIGTGSHGVASARNLAWNQQQLNGTGARIAGLRDVYQHLGTRAIYVWDLKGKRRVKIGTAAVEMPGRWWRLDTDDPDEVRRRYLTLRRGGVESPTAQQILRGYRRLVWLELVLRDAGAAPGGALRVEPRAVRIYDRKPAENIAVEIFEPEGDRVVSSRTGAEMPWVAPETPGRHRLALRLDPAVASVWEAPDPTATATYTVGSPTRVTLALKPKMVAPDGEAEVLVAVRGADDLLVSDGRVELRLEPDVGTIIPSAHARSRLADGEARSTITVTQRDFEGPVAVIAEYTGWALGPDFRAPSATRRTLMVAEAPPPPPDAGPPPPPDAGPPPPDAGPPPKKPASMASPPPKGPASTDGSAPAVDWSRVGRGLGVARTPASARPSAAPPVRFSASWRAPGNGDVEWTVQAPAGDRIKVHASRPMLSRGIMDAVLVATGKPQTVRWQGHDGTVRFRVEHLPASGGRPGAPVTLTFLAEGAVEDHKGGLSLDKLVAPIDPNAGR